MTNRAPFEFLSPEERMRITLEIMAEFNNAGRDGLGWDVEKAKRRLDSRINKIEEDIKFREDEIKIKQERLKLFQGVRIYFGRMMVGDPDNEYLKRSEMVDIVELEVSGNEKGQVNGDGQPDTLMDRINDRMTEIENSNNAN